METDEPSENHGKEKARRWMIVAIVFAFCFAITWSLGPFFFWMPLGLAAYFGFLAWHSSGINLTFFNRPKSPPPYGPYSQATTGPTAQRGIPKVIRTFIIAFGIMFFVFFLIGTFSGNNETQQEIITEESGTDTAAGDDAAAWNDKGNQYLDNLNYDSALICYDKALAIDPSRHFTIYDKGVLYSRKQEYRKSNALARECLRIEPGYNFAWWLQGYNFNQLNNTDSALYALEAAYGNNFDNPDFLEHLGETYLKKDKRAQATEVYKKVLGIDSNRIEPYKKLAQLDLQNADWYRKKASALEAVSGK